MSWLCSCGTLNSGLNESCAASKQKHEPWKSLEHKQVSVNTPDWAMATALVVELSMNSAEIRAFAGNIRLIDAKRLDEVISELENADTSKEEDWLVKQIESEKKRREEADKILAGKVKTSSMTPQEELFAKFYHHEKVLIKDMTYIQKREHRDDLHKIVFEGKARLSAIDDDLKEEKAKLSNKEWLVTDTKPSPNVSDAINAVKQRASRMSKMDKMRADLVKIGMDEATINEIIGNLEKKATDSKLKTITFTKPSTEIGAVQVKTGSKEPFNPASLGFACIKCKQNPCQC